MNIKKFIFNFLTIVISFFICLVTIELLFMFFYPQPTLYPRFKFSSKYGFELFENTIMKHEMYGKWRFFYSINKYGYRGKAVPISNAYDVPNIVVLGDSNSFGAGVDESHQYCSVMSDNLKNNYNVINLGTNGYGLSQEIRKYYEFGQLYKPKLVILQFASNDLDDNLNHRVTIIEDNKFKFVDSVNPYIFLKKYLSYSIIQKSNAYNFIRNKLYYLLKEKYIEIKLNNIKNKSNSIKIKENLYIELLDLFIKDLNRNNIKVIMIAPNNELDPYPDIKEKISDLNKNKLFTYVEVADWFIGKDIQEYGSPEGHPWGTKAHNIIGRKLSNIILNKGREKESS